MLLSQIRPGSISWRKLDDDMELMASSIVDHVFRLSCTLKPINALRRNCQTLSDILSSAANILIFTDYCALILVTCRVARFQLCLLLNIIQLHEVSPNAIVLECCFYCGKELKTTRHQSICRGNLMSFNARMAHVP